MSASARNYAIVRHHAHSNQQFSELIDLVQYVKMQGRQLLTEHTVSSIHRGADMSCILLLIYPRSDKTTALLSQWRNCHEILNDL